MPGCLTMFFRLLTEAILVRLVGRITDSLFGGTLSRWLKKISQSVAAWLRLPVR